MKPVIVAVPILAIAAFALGAWLTPAPTADTPAAADPALAARVQRLEAALEEERAARQLLEDELFRLIDDVGALERPADRPVRTAATIEPADALSAEDRRRVRAERQALRAAEQASQAQPPSMAERLESGGFARDRAEAVAQLDAKLRLDAIQARYEAQRNGESLDAFSAAVDPQLALREQLGDAEYERYLTALGAPTQITVNNIMEYSPAADAGLRQGDQILRYNGQRVFSVADLNRFALDGGSGGMVNVDILRDGQPLQVTMPEGPLGIYAGPGRRRGGR